MFGTGIGGIHSLCPRLGLRPSPELWARPSNAFAGLKANNKGEVCKGHPTSTSPGKAIHSVRAVHLPQHHPQSGHTGHMHLPACPGLASGRTRRQRGCTTQQLPRDLFSALCISCPFGGIFCTHEINRGLEIKLSLLGSPWLKSRSTDSWP